MIGLTLKEAISVQMDLAQKGKPFAIYREKDAANSYYLLPSSWYKVFGVWDYLLKGQYNESKAASRTVKFLQPRG